jgi:alanyl-tRNA synthetase
MTIRLYYDEPYLTDFSARVVELTSASDQPAVILDQTAFYPTSGGQPHDTGALGPARVQDVTETETGDILHVLDAAIAPGPVTGRIDWPRRFDHMQQHTGQHILSQAFIEVAGAQTLSFHLGQDSSTIDIALAEPTAAVLLAAERLASRIVFENRPVRILNVDRSRLSELGIRKETEREGEIRVIEVEGFDRSACGGTHIRSSAEAGMIFLPGFERYKGGTRVEFLCGERVLKAIRREHEILMQIGRIHSAHASDLVRLNEKLLEERTALTRDKARLEEQLMDFEAQELFDRGAVMNGVKIIRQSYPARSLDAVKLLAQKIVAKGKAVAVLGVAQNPAQLAAAKSREAPGDCGRAIKEISATLGGKGGGRPETAQAGGIPAERLEEWLQALENHIRADIARS